MIIRSHLHDPSGLQVELQLNGLGVCLQPSIEEIQSAVNGGAIAVLKSSKMIEVRSACFLRTWTKRSGLLFLGTVVPEGFQVPWTSLDPENLSSATICVTGLRR